MERLSAGEGYEGAKRERGYFPVEHTGHGLSRIAVADKRLALTLRRSEATSSGFRATASNETCEIQANAAYWTTPLWRSIPS